MTPDPLKTIFATDDQLDDLSRVRIWAALSPKVTSTPRARQRWPLVAWAGIAAAAVLVIVVIAARRASVEHVTAVEHVAPAGGVLALPLGPATRAVVEGPGRIVVEREGDTTAIELRSGTLYGEFTGGGGRSLRIRAAGAMIEIVGTLFAVTVADDTACLSVAHGRVRMTSGAVVVQVDGGQRACAVRGARPGSPSALDPATGTALAHYEHTWLAAAPVATPAAAAIVPADPIVAAVPAAPANPIAAPVPIAIAAVPAAPPPAPPGSPHSYSVATPAPDARSAAVAKTSSVAPPAESTAGTASPAKPTEPAAKPTAPPTTPAAAVAPAVVDKDLYRAADAAIAHGDPAAADRALAELLEHAPESSLADEARYDRARLAFERRDWAATRKLVASVQGSSPLREPAAYLGCRAAIEASGGDARACLTAYIAAFPHAPHTVDARVLLVELAYRNGGCDAVAAPLAELTAIAPRAAAVETWHRRCGAP